MHRNSSFGATHFTFFHTKISLFHTKKFFFHKKFFINSRYFSSFEWSSIWFWTISLLRRSSILSSRKPERLFFFIFSFWSYFLLLNPGYLYIIDRLGARNLNIVTFFLYDMSFKSYARFKLLDFHSRFLLLSNELHYIQ